jgi:hypothetical protein
MGKIVQYGQRTQTPGPSGGALAHGLQVHSDNGFGVLSAALGEAADALDRSKDEEARAWSAAAVSGHRLKWTQQFYDRSANAEPNAPDFSLNFVKDYDDEANELLKSAPTPRAKSFLATRLNEVREQLGSRAMEFESKARIDYRVDQFSAGIDTTAKLMNTDPSQYPDALREQVALIDTSALPPEKKSAMRQGAIEKISQAAVWSQIQKSPQAFLDSIGFGPIGPDGKARKTSGDLKGITGNEAFDALPFDQRGRMFEQAIRLKAQIDGDVERTAAKRRKELEDEAAKNLWSLHADGKLKRQHIEQARSLLSPPEYHSFLKTLQEGGSATVKSDPATFRELHRMIADNRFDEAVTFAFKAHQSGLLSNEHLASGVGQARSQGRQEGPRSEYERTLNYITMSMDQGPLVHDPVGRSRLAEARDTFERWVAAEKRTDAEIEKRGKEIVTQYKFINMSDKIIGLPNPRSGAIRRNVADTAGIMADVMAAAQEAQRRKDSKQYTEWEYQQEMRVINQWRKAVEGR